MAPSSLMYMMYAVMVAPGVVSNPSSLMIACVFSSRLIDPLRVATGPPAGGGNEDAAAVFQGQSTGKCRPWLATTVATIRRTKHISLVLIRYPAIEISLSNVISTPFVNPVRPCGVRRLVAPFVYHPRNSAQPDGSPKNPCPCSSSIPAKPGHSAALLRTSTSESLTQEFGRAAGLVRQNLVVWFRWSIP